MRAERMEPAGGKCFTNSMQVLQAQVYNKRILEEKKEKVRNSKISADFPNKFWKELCVFESTVRNKSLGWVLFDSVEMGFSEI